MDRSSLRVASIMGIPIHLHISFLVILPFLAWVFGNNIKQMAQIAGVPTASLGLGPYVWGLAVALALFGSVVLHELGHSYVAIRKGVKIRGITLMLFGGVAQLEEMPEKPADEAQIALAGPAVSFLVGAASYVALPLVGALGSPSLTFGLSYLGHINIALGVFNLLPAFPMDGGRVLRALLARHKPFVTATTWAANVGKVFAFGFGLLGLVNGNFVLVLIAFFIYLGASQEQQFTVIKTTLDGFRVRDLMESEVATVSAEDTLDELLSRMLNERHLGYPVVREGKLVGCVTLEDVQKASPDRRAITRVDDVMSTELFSVRPDDDIYLALKQISENGIGRLPVIQDGRLVGIISRSDIMDGFRIRAIAAGSASAAASR